MGQAPIINRLHRCVIVLRQSCECVDQHLVVGLGLPTHVDEGQEPEKPGDAEVVVVELRLPRLGAMQELCEPGFHHPDPSPEVLVRLERLDVRLKRRTPVYFVYLTAWATRDGIVQFRRDLYRRDGVGVAAASY